MKRTKTTKPRTDHKRLCSLFIIVEDARDRARAKLETAEQLETHLSMMTDAMLSIAGMAEDELLDQSDADNVYQMFIEAQQFVDTRNLTEVQQLTSIKLAAGAV